MAKIVLLLGIVVSFSLVEGRTGCWAGPLGSPGNVCIQNATLQGQISNDIRYSISSRYTYICCKAQACTDFRGCRLEDIGCFQGKFVSNLLPWELRDIHPLVRCSSNQPGYYQFEVQSKIV